MSIYRQAKFTLN